LALASVAAPRDVAKPTVDPAIYGHVAQVGWVVRDLDRVVSYWEKLGLKIVRPARVMEFPDTTYRGKRSPIATKMAIARIGGVEIHWIQPLRGESAFDAFLSKYGDGVHHLAYAVSSPEQLEQQVRYFKSKGVGVVQEGTWEGGKGRGRYVYLDTAERGGGLTVELAYDPDAGPRGAGAEAGNEYPFTRIVQYAFVVRDVRKVSDYFESLGLGALAVNHFVGTDRVYRGREASFEIDVGWNRNGDVPFEWVQPTSGPSVYDEHLAKRGEGFHHLAFDVRDMDRAIELLAAKGAPVVQSGGWDMPGTIGRYAYADTEPGGGVLVELLWNKP
jgi:catechol 2,3-dioxygenase-like lactoylglutathione lyase family enzyme